MPNVDQMPVPTLTPPPPAGEESFPGPTLPPRTPHPTELAALPAPLNPLLGRQDALASLQTLLLDPEVRLVTLTGPGGVGKTRLAVAAATDLASEFADGIAYVPLGAVTDPELVCVAIARLIGMRNMGEALALDRLIELFAHRQMLLVLDNFEHLLDASRGLARMLGECPGVTALVTSRVRLRLNGERELPIAPLALPSVSGGEDQFTAAVQLFLDRAQAVVPDFAITSANLPAVAEIVRRVDGLPLAIELAAVRVKALPPEALRQRMEQRLPLLTGGARDLPLRQQTMRDAIGWSYDLLTPDEQHLFRCLAVFMPGFTLAAAEAVAGGTGISLLDGVSSLVEQSLLHTLPDREQEPRYAMLETVREFGLERLQEQGETTDALRQHAAYMLQVTKTASLALYSAEQGPWLDRLQAEHANLRAALSWGLRHDPNAALRACARILRFWPIRGHLREARDWLIAGLAAQATAGNGASARGMGLVALAWVHYWQGDFRQGLAAAEEALGNSAAGDDLPTTGLALRVLGHCLIGEATRASPLDPADLRRASDAFQRQLAIWQSLADPGGEAAAMHNLGFLALHMGSAPEAREHFRDAMARFDLLGDRWSAALSRQYLAAMDAEQGNVSEAARHFMQTLHDFLTLGDRWKISYVLDGVAALLVRGEDAALGVRLLSAADALREADGITYLPVHGVGLPRPIAATQAMLGNEAFARAWSDGRTLSLDDAVDQASRRLYDIAEREPQHLAFPDGASVVPLTRREREVLRYLAAGRRDRDIARALNVSPRTVGGHVTNLLGKLGVESRTAAVAYALRHGFDRDGRS